MNKIMLLACLVLVTGCSGAQVVVREDGIGYGFVGEESITTYQPDRIPETYTEREVIDNHIVEVRYVGNPNQIHTPPTETTPSTSGSSDDSDDEVLTYNTLHILGII